MCLLASWQLWMLGCKSCTPPKFLQILCCYCPKFPVSLSGDLIGYCVRQINEEGCKKERAVAVEDTISMRVCGLHGAGILLGCCCTFLLLPQLIQLVQWPVGSSDGCSRTKYGRSEGVLAAVFLLSTVLPAPACLLTHSPICQPHLPVGVQQFHLSSLSAGRGKL